MAEEESGKRRVNLYLDKDLVEKAQELGINLSKVTNDMLEGLPETSADTDKAYSELFEKLKPILAYYAVGLKIGEAYVDPMDDCEAEIKLTWNGNPWLQLYPPNWGGQSFDTEFAKLDPVSGEDGIFDITNLPKFMKKNRTVFYLYKPKVIFSNLLEAIKEKKEENKNTVVEIEKIKRILTAIEPDLLGEDKPKRK